MMCSNIQAVLLYTKIFFLFFLLFPNIHAVLLEYLKKEGKKKEQYLYDIYKRQVFKPFWKQILSKTFMK